MIFYTLLKKLLIFAKGAEATWVLRLCSNMKSIIIEIIKTLPNSP